MPFAVYSTKFLENLAAPPFTDTFTVPAGYRAVVRDISGLIVLSLFEAVDCYVTNNGTAFYSASAPGPATTPFHWSGRCVVNELDDIAITLEGGTGSVNYVISGYLLTLP